MELHRDGDEPLRLKEPAADYIIIFLLRVRSLRDSESWKETFRDSVVIDPLRYHALLLLKLFV